MDVIVESMSQECAATEVDTAAIKRAVNALYDQLQSTHFPLLATMRKQRDAEGDNPKVSEYWGAVDEDVTGWITAVDAERGCDLCHTGDMLTLATFPSVTGYGKLTPRDNSIERCSCMMGQLITTSPTHAFGNVLRSVTRP